MDSVMEKEPMVYMLNWDADKPEICAAIRSHYAPLKILLKTKDEPERLRSWITHHAAIAGLEGLVILDNMSSDANVLAIYAEFEGRFPVIRFQGFHNNVHNVGMFPELYAALRQSCGYYCFMDTDELLVLYDGAERFLADQSIIEFLKKYPDVLAFPGTWLQSVEGYVDRYKLQNIDSPLSDGLCWGKPILSAAFDASWILLHNVECKRAMSPESLKTNLFVLHKHVASITDRIKINLLKLKSRRVLQPDDGISEALAIDTTGIEGGKEYIEEVRRFVAGAVNQATDDSFVIAPDGATSWNHPWQRAALQHFVNHPSLHCAKLFATF
jgi:hypothetical protein